MTEVWAHQVQVEVILAMLAITAYTVRGVGREVKVAPAVAVEVAEAVA